MLGRRVCFVRHLACMEQRVSVRRAGFLDRFMSMEQRVTVWMGLWNQARACAIVMTQLLVRDGYK
jgi:hypothetical protein